LADGFRTFLSSAPAGENSVSASVNERMSLRGESGNIKAVLFRLNSEIFFLFAEFGTGFKEVFLPSDRIHSTGAISLS
jgi:hypothetical protein